MLQTIKGKLGLLTLVVLALRALVELWDWIARLRGLDPYFGAEKNTTVGHILNLLFNPVTAIIVIVTFGLLWAYNEPFERWWQASRWNRAATLIAAVVILGVLFVLDLSFDNPRIAAQNDTIMARSQPSPAPTTRVVTRTIYVPVKESPKVVYVPLISSAKPLRIPEPVRTVRVFPTRNATIGPTASPPPSSVTSNDQRGGVTASQIGTVNQGVSHGRSRFHAELTAFYVQGSDAYRELSDPNISDAEIDKTTEFISAWFGNVQRFIMANMAKGANARFINLAQCNSLSFTLNGEHKPDEKMKREGTLTNLGCIMRNLDAMIQTDAYDP